MRTPAFTPAPNAHANVRSYHQSRAVCYQRNLNTALFAEKPTSSIEESQTVLSNLPVDPIFCMESGDLHEHFKAEYSEWSPSNLGVNVAPPSTIQKSEIPKKSPQTSNQYTKLFAD
jgi:hypothetical protein